MSIFSKKKSSNNKELINSITPAYLPSSGLGLECFFPKEYPTNSPEILKGLYDNAAKELKSVISTCDHLSVGKECDSTIDAQIDHCFAMHESVVAENDNQVVRIRAAREMRKEALERQISSTKEKIEKLKAEIAPLENLKSQFQIHIGKSSFSVALLITLIAMVVDGIVNFGYLQTILLSNFTLLLITVICMSIMSDGSMWALGNYISHRKEKFIPKPLFWTICVGLASMFVLSVVASVMIRWGSMDSTYGAVNASGEFIGKQSYSLAEYGVALLTSFVTTSTGLLSFAFSLDENDFAVSHRERIKSEMVKLTSLLQPLQNEYSLLVNAPDPEIYDSSKRSAAVHQINALQNSLKIMVRNLLAEKINDPGFTERMSMSADGLMREESPTDISTIPIAMNKAS